MSALRQFLRQSGLGRLGFALTVLLVVVALAAPWLAPASPTAQNLAERLAGPSAAHWMGTDELGRDILSRVIYGARISMLVSVSVVLGAGLFGLGATPCAGFEPGVFMDKAMRLVFASALSTWTFTTWPTLTTSLGSFT